MRKIVYILSSAHSGSTPLSLVLANHPKILALGEIYTWLSKGRFHENYEDPEQPCSCGKTMAKCDFWKDYQDFHKKHRYDGFLLKYKEVMSLVQEKYGEDTIIVDASKETLPLAEISKLPNVDIKVIFLLKDLRNLVVSRREKRKRIGRKTRLAIIDVLRWFRANQKLKKFLENGNYNFFQVGYEEVCLYPRYILPKICNFIGIEFREEMLKPAENERAHYAAGNRMRYQKDKKQGIFYDNR